jgi:hypothetical protein
MKLQRNSGDIRDNLAEVPLRQEKAWRVVLAARGMAELVRLHCGPGVDPHLVAPELLDRGEEICRSLLSPERVEQIRQEVDGLLSKLGQQSGRADIAALLA